MIDMVCSHSSCMAKALSRLPLMVGKKCEGVLPVCHEAGHVVWGGGQCYDFKELEEEDRQTYLQKLEDTLKGKILAKMELMGKW